MPLPGLAPRRGRRRRRRACRAGPLRTSTSAASSVALPPDSDLGRRFPDGCFRIAPAPGTALESVGGDELLFADGRSRGEPYLVLVTAAASSAGFRITRPSSSRGEVARRSA